MYILQLISPKRETLKLVRNYGLNNGKLLYDPCHDLCDMSYQCWGRACYRNPWSLVYFLEFTNNYSIRILSWQHNPVISPKKCTSLPFYWFASWVRLTYYCLINLLKLIFKKYLKLHFSMHYICLLSIICGKHCIRVVK